MKRFVKELTPISEKFHSFERYKITKSAPPALSWAAPGIKGFWNWHSMPQLPLALKIPFLSQFSGLTAGLQSALLLTEVSSGEIRKSKHREVWSFSSWGDGIYRGTQCLCSPLLMETHSELLISFHWKQMVLKNQPWSSSSTKTIN